MRTINHELGTGYFPETGDSIDGLWNLLDRGGQFISYDTESSGLNMYSPTWRLKLFQVGVPGEAWLLDPRRYRDAIERVMTRTKVLYAHNDVFDLLSLERWGGGSIHEPGTVPFDSTAARSYCTGTMAKLLDNRQFHFGGKGHSLEHCGLSYLRTGSKKDAAQEMKRHAKKEYGILADDFWEQVPIEDELFLRYAAQDIFLTSRLAPIFVKQVAERGLREFMQYERKLSRHLAYQTRKGVAYDLPYAKAAREDYGRKHEEGERKLREKWGIPPVKGSGRCANANAALIKKGQEIGYQFTKRTDRHNAYKMRKAKKDVCVCPVSSGKHIALDTEVMSQMNFQGGEIGQFARDLEATKKALHWAQVLDGCFAEIGYDGRIHATINPMGATTGRMSIARPSFQNFSTKEEVLRGGVIPDEGHDWIGFDYEQIEFRVGAGLSQDLKMIHRLKEGLDIHAEIAEGMYGVGYSPGQRNTSKGVTFGGLFLGGDAGVYQGIVNKMGIDAPPFHLVQAGRKALHAAYPVFFNTARRWVKEVDRVKAYVNGFGRPLMSTGFESVNYRIQSTARDILGHAVCDLWDAGYGQFVSLLVHDEVDAVVPSKDAEEVRVGMHKVMTTTFRGVPIGVESKNVGDRWRKM